MVLVLMSEHLNYLIVYLVMLFLAKENWNFLSIFKKVSATSFELTMELGMKQILLLSSIALKFLDLLDLKIMMQSSSVYLIVTLI